MKNILSISVVLALLVLSPPVSACGLIAGLFTSEDVSLSYVGTISFKKPTTEGDYTRIPLSFEGGKWLENSGRALKEVRSSRHEFEIHFTVVTCVVGSQSTMNPEIKLKGLVPGKYQLIYQNPDNTSVRVGEIEI
jgi:hypothetical protein